MRCGVLALLAVSLAPLSGCDKLQSVSSAECTSEDSKAVISSVASEQIEKAAKALVASGDGEPIASASKIRATVALIKISIQDIRTTKTDPNSTKKFCEGTLKVVMPLGMIQDADSAHSALSLADITKLAESNGMERSADTFSNQIEFSVQPTDDNKKIFGEVEGQSERFDFLGEVVAAHLAWPRLQSIQQSASAEAAAGEVERATQVAAQSQADLDMATAENKLANQTISEIWKSIPEVSRSELLDFQRAWIKKKTADCNIKAAETSTESVAREAARLRCDTVLTNTRSDELRAYL